MAVTAQDKWLLIFYTVPSKPVANRIRLWRKFAKAGAVPLKGAVYILPATEEHYELFEWLISEVASMGGDATFIKVPAIETMENDDIIKLFNDARTREYRVVEKGLDALERKIQSARKGTSGQGVKGIDAQLTRLTRDFEQIKVIDFFSTRAGAELAKRIKAAETVAAGLSGEKSPGQALDVAVKDTASFQAKTWATRKHPFVDRMASAWLIRGFIDPGARFMFMDERDVSRVGPETVTFDVRGGVFTHHGELCTFEVLVKSFGIKDKTVRKIAEIVHDLDVKDEKYGAPEARGIEEILAGIRKTATSDNDALEKGMAVFNALYAAKQ